MLDQRQLAIASGIMFTLMGFCALGFLSWMLRNGMRGYFEFVRDRMPRYQKYEGQLWVLTYANVAIALFLGVALVAFDLLFVALGLST